MIRPIRFPCTMHPTPATDTHTTLQEVYTAAALSFSPRKLHDVMILEAKARVRA